MNWMDSHAPTAQTMPTRRLNVREQLVLSIYWFSLNIQSAALIPIVIPLQILLFFPSGHVGNTQQAVLLGWITAVGAVFSLLMPPILGLVSDNTPGRWGRRRPYIAAGTVLLIVSAVLLGAANSILFFVIALAINQIGSNVANTAYQALLPDRVPKEQRGEASGYMGLMTIIGNVGSLGLAVALLGNTVNLVSNGSNAIQHGVWLFYILTGVALLGGGFITVFGIREAPFVRPERTISEQNVSMGERFHRWFVKNWIVPWRSANFMLIFCTRFAVMMGLTLFMTFIEYYFANVDLVTNFVQATAIVALLALVGALCSAFGLGVLSDRIKRAPIVCVSTLLMAMASFTFVIAPGSFPLWILGILFGVGYGAYMSVDWALGIDVLPSMDTVGKDLALWGASDNIPSIVAPALGSLIIAIVSLYAVTALGYRCIFAVATVFLIAGALLILKIRV